MKLRFAMALVTLSGFISLSYELLWYRVFSFSVSGAAYAFALLLWAYLTGIAVGSHAARTFCDDQGAQRPSQLRILAIFILAANLGGFLSIPLMASMHAAGLHPGLSLVPVLVVAGALGAQLPLICHYGIAPDERAGERLSYLYVGNIVGSVVGSLLTGFVLFDVWSLETIAAALTVLGVGAALGLFAVSRPSKSQLVAASLLGLGAALGAVAAQDTLYQHLWERLLQEQEYDDSRSLKHVVENKSGVITVNQRDQIYGGGVYDGQFSIDLLDDSNLIVRPFALGLLHPNPRKLLVIGLASGSWASVLANHPDVEEVTIIEINPGYLEIIDNYEPHRRLLDDPRVEIVIDDARRWLNRVDGRKFDAIVANTTFHWSAQVSNLLSREWLELISGHLEPGGVYIFNPTSSPRAVKTAMTTFQDCMRIINNTACSMKPFEPDAKRWRQELLAYELWGEPVLDIEQPAHQKRLDEILELADINHGDRPRKLYQFEGGDSLRRVVGDAEIITDDNMGAEWEAFLLGQ